MKENRFGGPASDIAASLRGQVPLNWYYISFANPQFEGAMIVQGVSFEAACDKAVSLGAKPEWRPFGINVSRLNAPIPDPEHCNRLLSKHDVETIDFGKDGKPGAKAINICENCEDRWNQEFA